MGSTQLNPPTRPPHARDGEHRTPSWCSESRLLWAASRVNQQLPKRLPGDGAQRSRCEQEETSQDRRWACHGAVLPACRRYNMTRVCIFLPTLAFLTSQIARKQTPAESQGSKNTQLGGGAEKAFPPRKICLKSRMLARGRGSVLLMFCALPTVPQPRTQK